MEKVFDLRQKWVYVPTGRIFEIVWITPDIKGFPVSDRIIYLQDSFGGLGIIPVPMAIADIYLRSASMHVPDPPAEGPELPVPV